MTIRWGPETVQLLEKGLLTYRGTIPEKSKVVEGVVEKFAGKTKRLRLEELRYTLQKESGVVRFDARVSFYMGVDDMEETTLQRVVLLLDADMEQLVQESAKVKSRKPPKRTLIIE